MKQRMIYAGALVAILMCLCTTKPITKAPQWFGIQVSVAPIE